MELMVEFARGQLRVRLLSVPQTYTKRCVPSGMRWGAEPEKSWCLGPETRLAYRVLTPRPVAEVPPVQAGVSGHSSLASLRWILLKQKAKCQGFQGSPTCPGELPSTHLHEMVPKHLCHHPIISQASVGIRAESAPYRWPSVGKDPCGEVTGPAAGGLSADSLGGNPPEGSLPVSGSPRTPPASHRPEAPVHRHPPVDGKVKRWGPFILPPLGVWNEDTQGVASVPSLRRMVFTPSQSASHPPTLWESRLVASTLRLPPGPRGDKASQGFRPQQLLLTCRPACLEPTCPALGHPHRPSNSWLGRQTSHLFSPLPLPPTSGLLYLQPPPPDPFLLEKRCFLHPHLQAGSGSTGG